MSPLQILWVNMVTSSPPALGLAAEKAEPTVMHESPRGQASILLSPGVILDIIFYGFFLGLLSLANFVIVAFGYGDGTRHTINCNYELTEDCEHLYRARATCFGTMTSLLLLHAYNCKDLKLPLTRMTLLDNRILLYSVVGGFITLPLTFYIPLVNTDIFLHAAISWEWGLILCAMALFTILSEVHKRMLRPTILRLQHKMRVTRRRIKTSDDLTLMELDTDF